MLLTLFFNREWILPLSVSKKLLRLDVPLMIVLSVLVLIISLNGVNSPIEGAIFAAGLISYTTFLIVQSRKEWVEPTESNDKQPAEWGSKAKVWLVNSLLVVGGLALLMGG